MADASWLEHHHAVMKKETQSIEGKVLKEKVDRALQLVSPSVDLARKRFGAGVLLEAMGHLAFLEMLSYTSTHTIREMPLITSLETEQFKEALHSVVKLGEIHRRESTIFSAFAINQVYRIHKQISHNCGVPAKSPKEILGENADELLKSPENVSAETLYKVKAAAGSQTAEFESTASDAWDIATRMLRTKPDKVELTL